MKHELVRKPIDALSATARSREVLARRVIERVNVISVKLVELQDDIRALWQEFENLPAGETIAGCSTKKEFCERILHRTPRAIRYMLAGGNPDQKQGEILSPPVLSFHPLTEIIPEMDEATFESLVASIQRSGMLLPIWIYEGKILDGRARWRACQRLNIDCPQVVYKGDDPLDLILSLNAHRQSLSEDQRAMIAAQTVSS